MNRMLYSYSMIFLMVFSSLLVAEDWDQYRGPDGDGKSVETLSNVAWSSDSPDIVWKASTPLGFSSFAIADGRAFTLVAKKDREGKNVESCVAFDARNGDELWSVSFGLSDYGHDGGNAGAPDNKGGDGPRSTPSIDGKYVYIYDAHQLLTCLNAADGEVVWQRNVFKEFAGEPIKWMNATSPLIVGDIVYVGGGGAGQAFLAFNKKNGEVVWKSGRETITHATPTFTEIDGIPQVIFFVQAGLVSVNVETGEELWRSEFPFSVSTAASPVVDGNLVYCSAGYGVGAQLVEIKNGQVEKKWFKANRLMNHWSTPLVYKGHLYGIFEFKKYGKAPLQCVELATGEIKWSERGFGPGNCILVGDKLIALSDTGEVVMVDAKPDQYNEFGRIKAVDGKCWSTPAFSDGRLYVRSTEEGACLDLSN